MGNPAMSHQEKKTRNRIQRAGACCSGGIRSGIICSTVALAAVSRLAGEVVTFRLEVVNTWSSTTHPGGFPGAAHFSWLGGGTHNDQVHFWQEGEPASPGMKRMAESGYLDMLLNEVDAQTARAGSRRSQTVQRNAFQSLAWRWWFCPPETNHENCGETTVTFEVDRDFPRVTLVTMLGPSPDWFVGTTGLSLRENGRWVSQVVVDLHPFDAGTRSANRWDLWGPENNPPESIRLVTDASGQLIGSASLGTMTFTRVLQGDLDEDGDVDLADYLVLFDCFAGPGEPISDACCSRNRRRDPCDSPADFDEDGDVDLNDILIFQAAFTGAR